MKNLNLKNHLGERVTLYGIAQNAKGYAVLLTEDEKVIYIRELAEWPEDLLDSSITIKGILRHIKLIPDPNITENGAISQGAQGLQYVLTNYEIIE